MLKPVYAFTLVLDFALDVDYLAFFLPLFEGVHIEGLPPGSRG